MKFNISYLGRGQQKDLAIFLDLAEKPRAKDLAKLLNKLAQGSWNKESTKNTFLPSAGLVVDGKHFAPETLLVDCHLFAGSSVQIFNSGKIPAQGETLALALVGGVEAGKYLTLNSNPLIVGRSSRANLIVNCPGISPRHLLARLDFRGRAKILDLNSQNGTATNGTNINESPHQVEKAVAKGGVIENSYEGLIVEDLVLEGLTLEENSRIRIGNSYISAKRVKTQENEGLGYIRFNRAPKILHTSTKALDLESLTLPTKTNSVKNLISFSWAAVVAPILFGGTMAILVNPYMALFMLMSPLMAIASWLESKFRGRRSRIQLRRKHTKELATLKVDLQKHLENEKQKREEQRLDPLDLFLRIQNGDSQLWERRADHLDFLKLSIGSQDLQWKPKFVDSNASVIGVSGNAASGNAASENASGSVSKAGNSELLVTKMLEELKPLFDVPLEISLKSQTLGIVGNRHIALNLARWLILQAATLHGPSDLELKYMGYLPREWYWMSWLPHYKTSTDELRASSNKACLWILDSWSPNFSDTDLFLGRNSCAIVLATDAQGLPADCDHIIKLWDNSGSGKLTSNTSLNTSLGNPASNNTEKARVNFVSQSFRVDGVPRHFALLNARRLARYRDPEAVSNGAPTEAPTEALPKVICLGELLGLPKVRFRSSTQEQVDHQITRWQETEAAQSSKSPSLKVPIGWGYPRRSNPKNNFNAGIDALNLDKESEENTIYIDLINDGPHGLIAGTTGSGKSELLRTLVTGMAHIASPELLNFVLIDYKGGSAFDMCVDLPHTVGMVTDLNPDLSQRALIALRAELTRREKLLRKYNAEDIASFYLQKNTRKNTRAITGGEARDGANAMAGGRSEDGVDSNIDDKVALPRLLILVDEFATMAEELPNFLNSLVEIARRGRSLGVHLILATQRPSGAISPNIRSNTNFRIGFRVVSEADSMDILDCADAVEIPKDIPGRACIRIAMGQPQTFQAAQASIASPTYPGVVGISEIQGDLKTTSSNFLGNSSKAGIVGATSSDISQIVEIAGLAYSKMGGKTPHKPWPEPLPKTLDIDNWQPDQKHRQSLGDRHSLDIGLVDMPENQALETLRWELHSGNLSLVGKKSARWLMALGIWASRWTANLHLFVLDFGDNLQPLQKLPQCSAFCSRSNIELLNQIFEHLRTRVKKPKESPALVLLNQTESLFSDLEATKNFSRIEELNRLILEGPASHIHWAMGFVAPTNSGMLKSALRIHSGLTSPQEYLEAGVFNTTYGSGSRQAGDLFSDKEFLGDTKKEVRLITCKNPDLAVQEISAQTDPSDCAPKLEVLPRSIKMKQLLKQYNKSKQDVQKTGAKSLVLPFGVASNESTDNKSVAAFDLSKHRHLLIAGPSGSGKSTALRSFALSAKRAGAYVAAICSPRSPLSTEPNVQTVAKTPTELDEITQPVDAPVLLLIDDATHIDDPEEILHSWTETSLAKIHIIAAGRNDLLQRHSQKWLNEIKSYRSGLLFGLDPLDGELFGVKLPLLSGNQNPLPPGRALMVAQGQMKMCQVGLPKLVSPVSEMTR